MPYNVGMLLFEAERKPARALAYSSGANAAGQVRGHAENGEPFGISAADCNRRCLGEVYRAAADPRSRIFVDSGVYSQAGGRKRMNFDRVLERQEYIAQLYGPRALIVAPDVLADPEGTLQLLSDHRDQLRRIQDTGAEVMIAVQDFDRPQAFWQRASALIPDAVPGWPSSRRAQDAQDVATFLEFISPFPRVHLLGLGVKGTLFGVPYQEALEQLPTGIQLSTDANERRRQVRRASGYGRVTAAEDVERRELEIMDPYLLGDELADSGVVPVMVKMRQWESASMPELWWWAYIAGADPAKTPEQNQAFFRSHFTELVSGYGPGRGSKLRLQLQDASGRWFREVYGGDEDEAEAFQADPVAAFDDMLAEGDGSLLDALQDAYQALQLRLASQEVKRRGVRRVRKAEDAPIVVVGCGKQKREDAAKASDLYTGGVFSAHKAIADHFGGIDYVVSAKMGLVRGDKVISPYDTTMQDLTPSERSTWASQVGAAISRLAHEGRVTRPVLALVGKAYSGWIPVAEADGVRVVAPLEGLTAGERRKAARMLTEGQQPPPLSVPWDRWVRQGD